MASKINNVTMSSFLFLAASLVTTGRGQNPTFDPDEILEGLTETDPSSLLRTIFSFMSDDEFALLDPITSSLSGSDMHDPSKWEDLVDDSTLDAAWDAVHEAAETTCKQLDLSSPSCYADCINYNSIPTWLELMASNNTADKQQLFKMVKLYSVSAGPISWYDVGNVDQCEFFEGTYCYTPAYSGYGESMQHACCVPGTCTGWDATKVVSTNNWCYKTYHDLFAKVGATVFPVCVPSE